MTLLATPGLPAVFVDRDGPLIRDIGYLCRPDQLEILPGVPRAICLLRETGLKVVVVTNQSAIARGLLDEGTLGAIHDELRLRLAKKGAVLDGIYYCPHHPTEGLAPYRVVCDCRKPNVGLIERAARELWLNPSLSYVVGDQRSDMELAVRVRAKGVWIREKNSSREAPVSVCHTAKDLWSSAQWILADFNGRARSVGKA